MDAYEQLDPQIKSGIEEFTADLKKWFGEDLCAVYLIGSAVEARVRIHSDINLIVILNQFDIEKSKALREEYRIARASINLNAMFILKSELAEAIDAFPVKFVDVKMRHRLLNGTDVLAETTLSKEKLQNATKQTILNTRLRLRERYILVSLRREQLARMIAEFASSLRAAAASIVYLEGRKADSPRDALKKICEESNDTTCTDLLDRLSRIREKGLLDNEDPDEVVKGLMAMTCLLSDRLDRLASGS